MEGYLITILRNATWRALNGYKQDRKEELSSNTRKYLGCSTKELVEHIESTWRCGMCWGNYGSEWHIDHKLPLKPKRKISKEEKIKRLHYKNLQALWASENLSKSNKEDWKPNEK